MHCQLAVTALQARAPCITKSGCPFRSSSHALGGRYPLIFILVRLLAQQQLINQHAKGIHIALHAQLTPIECLRWVHVLRPACRSVFSKPSMQCLHS